MADITLVAALGNYGAEYAQTRHNIAWQLLDHLSFEYELNWQEKFKGHYASYTMEGEKIFFLKPQTYMNLSGQSLIALMHFFKIELGNVLVIHDELELPFGVAGFKEGGGLAGHNGLRSVAATLGTRDFKRMRLGIDRPPHKDITSYVLGRFTPDEQIVLPTFLDNAARLLETALESSFPNMLKKYRKEKLIVD